MNIAIYKEDKIITNVIKLDIVPEPTETEFFAECPPWCWIGDSIDKPKPDDYIEPEEVYQPSMEERLAAIEQAIIELAELEGNKK